MKMNIRKKLVSLAVASAVSGGVVMTIPAQANMNVSQDNVGQVLLFPYYTVKNGFDTLFSVTNTSENTLVLKVRWREALNSREVRDFNVILSPYDVWNGAVTNDGDGAMFRTFDKSCTSPILPASAIMSGAREINFTNALFSGNFTDGATEDITRVKEGYFEVFLMGVSSRSPSISSNVLEYNAKHVSGTPRDCAKVDALFLDAPAINGYMSAPTNVLKGHSTFINVASGKAIDVEPTALEGFRTGTSYVAAPGDLEPSLANGDAVTTVQRFLNASLDDAFIDSTSQDAVSELLRATSVINEYATGINAQTSWVLTFPTKHHYTDAYVPKTGPTFSSQTNDPSGGFSDWFFTKNSSGTVIDGKSCDNIGLDLWNREEGGVTPGGTSFSPAPTSSSIEMCYEVNVLDFNSSSVFGAGVNRLGVNTSEVGAAGWAELTFSEAPATTAGGLPVIGFSAIVRDGSDATVNYGSSTVHSYSRAPMQDIID
jgi:hypothetical protein